MVRLRTYFRGLLAVTAVVMCALVVLGRDDARAAGDPDRGAVLYRECAACHSLYREERQAGPPLRGVFGRQAGTVSDFQYSQAMRDSGIIWTHETLKAWLSDPLTFIPGSRKRGHSVWQDERLDDLLAYLKRAQGTSE